MALNGAFQPMGNTYLVQQATAGTQSNAVAIAANSPCQQYSLINSDTVNTAFVSISTSATSNAAVPNAAGTAVYPVPAFGYQVISSVQTSPTQTVYVRVIGSAGTPAVYVCPGEGL